MKPKVYAAAGAGKTRSWVDETPAPSTLGWSFDARREEMESIRHDGSDVMREQKHIKVEDLGFRLARDTWGKSSELIRGSPSAHPVARAHFIPSLKTSNALGFRICRGQEGGE